MLSLEKQLEIHKSNNEKYKKQIKLLKKEKKDLNQCVRMIKKYMNIDNKPENKCLCCGINLEGWIYYKKGVIKICHFCFNSLERVEDE